MLVADSLAVGELRRCSCVVGSHRALCCRAALTASPSCAVWPACVWWIAAMLRHRPQPSNLLMARASSGPLQRSQGRSRATAAREERARPRR